MENAFIILFGFTMLYVAATSRLAAHVNVLVLQGILLFLICVLGMNEISVFNLLFIAFETLLIKSVIIPTFLGGLIKRTKEYRDTEANIHHFYSLFIATVILFAGFLVSSINMPAMKMINPLYFGISFATDKESKKIPFSIVIKSITLETTLCFTVIKIKLIIITAIETPKYNGFIIFIAGIFILENKKPAKRMILEITKQ